MESAVRARNCRIGPKGSGFGLDSRFLLPVETGRTDVHARCAIVTDRTNRRVDHRHIYPSRAPGNLDFAAPRDPSRDRETRSAGPPRVLERNRSLKRAVRERGQRVKRAVIIEL